MSVSISTVIFLLIAAILNGLLGGSSFDKALVSLPARKKIGAITFATYSRANDLGRGLIVYPILGIGAPILTIVGFIMVLFDHESPWGLIVIAGIAASLSIAHIVTTSRAAPIMLGLKNLGDDDDINIASILDRFTRWHVVRAILQVSTMIFSILALVVLA
ncbi:MAG TPA: hypothetical protein VKM55_18155 [Candidatus Lokiarchaeia archaeon]|nr:hypothetical protein [Candidatus Lokiarchaeia archaeon]